MANQWGLEKLGFLTLTFADHVTDIREARRRFNSLRTNVLKSRYPAFITVVERQKSGRVHFHLLVVLGADIRSGFNWEEVSKGVYASANPSLRSEWAFWRSTAKRFGFGRTELMPIRSTEYAIGRYVGKYIAKHLQQRRQDDKGARLVSYAVDARKCSSRFAWVGVKPWLWRAKLAQFAARHGVRDVSEMAQVFGVGWAHRLGGLIAQELLQDYPTVKHAVADGVSVPPEVRESAISVSRSSSPGSIPLPVEVVEKLIRDQFSTFPATSFCLILNDGIVRKSAVSVSDDPGDVGSTHLDRAAREVLSQLLIPDESGLPRSPVTSSPLPQRIGD